MRIPSQNLLYYTGEYVRTLWVLKEYFIVQHGTMNKKVNITRKFL